MFMPPPPATCQRVLGPAAAAAPPPPPPPPGPGFDNGGIPRRDHVSDRASRRGESSLEAGTPLSATTQAGANLGWCFTTDHAAAVAPSAGPSFRMSHAPSTRHRRRPADGPASELRAPQSSQNHIDPHWHVWLPHYQDINM
ncbi:hypothetical protein H696_00169 [Fonticula alba]|uniref:Uncharacterized protein n=1 Tax=Fonticula alba TaxID=691883 RepID=A0A058ZF66_FONAL|nr:hypothetical protein H696_00169 [Fonticula alba]KCV72578.1 hypothetical protein H696_00169 [Fonticula alba]|eukprot:XP_009492279.1 hypothetical protein H696_00169 [Fonticula alba]